MSNISEKEKILDQGDLAEIYAAQEEGNWKLVQQNQANLRATLVNNYEENWQKYSQEHPKVMPVFDLTDKNSQVISIDKEIAKNYNLAGHLAEFYKKSDNSTAGIRAFYDFLHSENPSMMYNDLFLALLIDAEAQFLPDVHKEIKDKISKIKNKFGTIENFVKDLRTKLSTSDLRAIEEIHQMPLIEIIKFLETNMVKLVGGEVRAHTAKFVELESRILAAKGITVLTPPNYSDSVPIYMHSFLTFILGGTLATNYTPSHSSNYLFGRKVLASGGGQLLPDKYEIYRETLRTIIEDKIINGNGYEINISTADDSHILHTLTYDRATSLYASILNITTEDVALINKATKSGHSIIMNGLNGSTWKTLVPILKHLKIDESVFKQIYTNEDPFFEIGFVATKDGDKFGIDHLGTDVSMTKVARTIPYDKMVGDAPLGTILYECDADSDRFCIKQVVERSRDNLQLAKDFGIDIYELDESKMLVALSPNKEFLLLDIADYELMKENGAWDDFHSLYIMTYVSTRAWAEFADNIPNMKKVVTRVGYKNLTEMQQVVEKWYFGQPEKQEFSFKDQIGNIVNLDRSKKIRIHCKSEESGGRVAGMNKGCFNIFAEQSLAMPEKSDPDSLLSELTISSKVYLANGMKNEYRLLNRLANAFTKYNLKSKIDARIDIMHADQGAIALMSYKKQQEALNYAGSLKANFNNFFFSLGRAVRDNKLEINRVKEVLKAVLPEFSDTWECVSGLTLSEEPLSGGRFRPEGVPIAFKAQDGIVPLVTELDFRPSGTDPLKSKVYIDAEALSDLDKKKIEKAFSNMTEYNLFDVLDYFDIDSLETEPKNGLNLKKYSFIK